MESKIDSNQIKNRCKANRKIDANRIGKSIRMKCAHQYDFLTNRFLDSEKISIRLDH